MRNYEQMEVVLKKWNRGLMWLNWNRGIPIRLSYKLRLLLIWNWNFRCRQRKDVFGSKSSSRSHSRKLFTVLFSDNFVILSVNKNRNNYYCEFKQTDLCVCYKQVSNNFMTNIILFAVLYFHYFIDKYFKYL